MHCCKWRADQVQPQSIHHLMSHLMHI
jgi:hypothetical protein